MIFQSALLDTLAAMGIGLLLGLLIHPSLLFGNRKGHP
jgi:hypothetical protein